MSDNWVSIKDRRCTITTTAATYRMDILITFYFSVVDFEFLQAKVSYMDHGACSRLSVYLHYPYDQEYNKVNLEQD